MTENEKLVETLKAGLKRNPPIKVSLAEYNHLCDMIENPKPAPALILAMERGRRLRESAKKDPE